MTADRRSRRTVLASIGVGVSALVAGCGYQASGGELDWERTVEGGFGPHSIDDELWLGDGASLYWIRNREGSLFDTDGTIVTAYDSSGETAWTGEVEHFYESVAAVASGTVFLAFENGVVRALERGDSDSDESSTGDPNGVDDWMGGGGPSQTTNSDHVVNWTSRRDDDLRSLVVDGDLLVGTTEDDVVGYDTNTGDDRFSLSIVDDLGFEPTDDPIDEIAVAGGRAWLRSGDELRAVDDDGTVLVDRSLPADGDWLVATDSAAALEVNGELWTVDPSGDRSLSLDLDRDGTPTIVADRDRLYHAGSGGLVAVDLDEGAVAWERDDYSFQGGVADGDGFYGFATGSACELVMVTSDGEVRWNVPAYAELECTSNIFLVGDRLVVEQHGLYGFRTYPGTRRSIL